MGYDIKYKMRSVEYQMEGHIYKKNCKVFKVSETTLTRWIKRVNENNLQNKIRERKPKKIHPEKLVKYIKKSRCLFSRNSR